MTKQKFEVLLDVQERIDEKFDDYLKEQFLLKKGFASKNKDLFDERDRLLKSLDEEEYKLLFVAALCNFTEFHSVLPIKETEKGESCYDVEFIKSIKTEFMDGYKMKATIELYENPYVEDKVLERTFNLETGEDSCMSIKYKQKDSNWPIFLFFEDDNEFLEIYDLLNEFYMNIVFYATMSAGEEQEENEE